MKERPILFNDEMVRAILEGRKAQTRRVVKPARGLQSTWASISGLSKCPTNYICELNGRLGAQFQHPQAGTIQGDLKVPADSPFGWFACEYGKPGDRLWVREAWRECGPYGIKYRATWNKLDSWPWQSASDMPRFASRITLEIAGVRVERVQDISEADAKAEGVQERHLDDLGQTWKTYQRGFESLWNSISSGDKSWSANPWVWVIEFRRVES